jgi:hypothetical protein
LPNAPSTLCGFPTVTQGSAGLPVSLRACRTCTCSRSYFQSCPAWFQLSWLTYQARYVRVQVTLGRIKARCLVGTSPQSPRLAPCVRLSPHTAQHLWSFSMAIHEASVPISPAPQCIPRGQLARSLGTFVPIFPKARGLCRQFTSWCTWLSHARTTMPHPTLPEGLGVSLGSPLPTSRSPSHPSGSLPCSL